MQERHNNRSSYFRELAETCTNYFIPYIKRWHAVEPGMKVLEIGCGEGGNLLPFARMGCQVTGVDIAATRIDEAREFFAREQAEGTFIADNIFNLRELEHTYDIILCHDVLEHLPDKDVFLGRVGSYLSPGGVVFMSFPAWQMPFGGHQQICRSRLLSHLPFVHLLPRALYRRVIRMAGESDDCLRELLSIKETRISIEMFERLLRRTDLRIQNRTLYFINPHYRVKFGLAPRRLVRPFSSLPYVRNFLCSSCFYLLQTT